MKKICIFVYTKNLKIMNEKSKQHSQLPNDMEVQAKDRLVYLVIKSFQNGETKECFPSLDTIAEKAQLSVPTIRDSIKRLEAAEYITVLKKGRKNHYIFSPYKKWEPFSPEFINRKDITPTTKSYLLSIQQYMFKDIEGIGKVSLSNRELSRQSGIPEKTIRNCNKELERMNFLTTLKNDARDLESGCKTDTKVYNLRALGQAIIWKLKEHDDRITKNEEDIQTLTDRLNSQQKLIEKLLAERNQSSENTFTM